MIDIHTMTISKIKALLTDIKLSPFIVESLSKDSRAGVRNLAEQYKRMQEKQRFLEEQWVRMTEHENQFKARGLEMIAGVDEVGRGPLAGPVVAAAVILPSDFYLPGLNDSKKLSAVQRESFYREIKDNALSYSITSVDEGVIDQMNIYQATQKAIREAIANLSITPEVCLVDGLEISHLSVSQKAIVGGDRSSITIAAASVLAKVTRDRCMSQYALLFPEYGFERNAGYPTPEHLKAIERHGPCPIHRKTFAGVKEWL